MYDKSGSVLRIETVINQPEEFRVRRRVRRRGRRRTEWVPLRKSVAYLFRYRGIALQSNSRYLTALAQVEDPTAGLKGLDAITVPKTPADGRRVKAFNPIAQRDGQLFRALMSGEHTLHGFANRDLRAKLQATSFRLHEDPTKHSGQVSRLLHRLHVYGLVAKIPRSRRWRVSGFGHPVMSAALRLREIHFPGLHAAAARIIENFSARTENRRRKTLRSTRKTVALTYGPSRFAHRPCLLSRVRPSRVCADERGRATYLARADEVTVLFRA